MSNFSDSFDIYYIRVRVSESLDIDRFGILLDGCTDLILIEDIDEGGADAVLWKGMSQ